jgi:hypothetical protein
MNKNKNKNKILYRIMWLNSITNKKGHGELYLTKENAEKMIIDLKERHPYMEHWISDK